MAENQADLYRSTQNELFEEWRKTEWHRNQVFNCDGIVNPDIWFSDAPTSGKRILFLLKEAYHDNSYQAVNGLDYSLTDNLRTNAIKSTTWSRIAEWSYGITHTTPTCLPEYRRLNSKQQKSILNQIAVINLKKSNGNPRSDKEDISFYVQKDKELLKKQLTATAPRIIVCGYTFKWLNEILDGQINVKSAALGTWCYKWQDAIIINYYHPANQFPALLNYYGIVGIYQKALESVVCRT